MPLRPCLEPGCPELVERGRCPVHASLAGAHRSVYRHPRWRQARERAIVRAGGRCQALERSGRCPARSGLHGHHDYPGGVRQMLRDGADPFDVRFIVVLCDKHHGRLEQRLRGRRR